MPALLLGLLVLGAVGLFLVMPGGRASLGLLGMLLLAAAGAALIYGVAQYAAGEPRLGWFISCALVGLFAAIRVVTHRKPVYSALYFVLLVVAVTGLLLLAEAEFLAAALIIVYAGAIMVTYVFVIMLAQQGRPALYDTKAREPFWGCLAGFVLLGVVASRIFVAPEEPLSGSTSLVAESAGTVEAVGTRLLTHYIVAIQLIGILLLAAMVGAVSIARRKATETLESGGVD